VARSTLPGRLLDPGSNVGARGMITLFDLPERQNPAYRPASAVFSHPVPPCRGDRRVAPILSNLSSPIRSHVEMNRVIPALRPRSVQMIHLMDAVWEKIYYLFRNYLNIREENNDK